MFHNFIKCSIDRRNELNQINLHLKCKTNILVLICFTPSFKGYIRNVFKSNFRNTFMNTL